MLRSRAYHEQVSCYYSLETRLMASTLNLSVLVSEPLMLLPYYLTSSIFGSDHRQYKVKLFLISAWACANVFGDYSSYSLLKMQLFLTSPVPENLVSLRRTHRLLIPYANAWEAHFRYCVTRRSRGHWCCVGYFWNSSEGWCYVATEILYRNERLFRWWKRQFTALGMRNSVLSGHFEEEDVVYPTC